MAEIAHDNGLWPLRGMAFEERMRLKLFGLAESGAMGRIDV